MDPQINPYGMESSEARCFQPMYLAMNPLVSILIPAHNAEKWITESIRSAIAQTWPYKEIIVVDDGSTDRTAEVARRFASKEVAVVSTENQGAAAARNHALQFSQGDYIQWLDADDILAPDKIQRQLAALRKIDSKRILLSSAWAYFNYRTERARFVTTSLWQDLSPVEWLVRKMGEGLYMQTATWLTSRELTQATVPGTHGFLATTTSNTFAACSWRRKELALYRSRKCSIEILHPAG